MVITEISYTDIPGRIFDGYDLHLELRKRGFDAYQIVKDKISRTESVIGMSIDSLAFSILLHFEDIHNINNTLVPFAGAVERLPEYINADLVHFHILHNEFFSIYDYPRMMNNKKSVWTIHDLWIAGGGCIQPVDCDGAGLCCKECKRHENAEFMFDQKRKMIKQVDPLVIVSTEWMKKKLKQSPVTDHFSRVEIVPFGIDADKYRMSERDRIRRDYGIDRDALVLGFRVEDNPLKGCKYIYEALSRIERTKDFVIMGVGSGKMPESLKSRYRTIELGWLNDVDEIRKFYISCDIFLMPSLGESFGLMAIEAMAAECMVICFKDTVLEEIADCPEAGIAVKHSSSDELYETIVRLDDNRQEVRTRGEKSKKHVVKNYTFERYINEHIRIYEELINSQ